MFRLTALLLSALLTVHAQAQSVSVRFDELPRLVREQNGNAVGARQAHSAATERTGYLKRSFLPSLQLRTGHESAKVGREPRDSRDHWSMEARANIFNGGKDRLEEDILQSHAKASAAQADRDYQSELKQARQLYWNLVATHLLITDFKDAIEHNEENIRSAKRRAGAGVTTAADRVQFELEKTSLIQNLKKLEHEEDVLRTKLAVRIGNKDHDRIRIEALFPHPPEAEFQEIQLEPERNLDVEILRQNESAERLRARQAGRWYLPRIDLYAKYGVPSLADSYSISSRKERELISGVSLTLDLGQSLHDRATERAQTFEAQAFASRANFRTQDVQAESHELQHDLRLLHELIHDADHDVKKAEEFLRLTKSEYTRGVKNGPDLLEAFSKLLEFKKRKTELNLEYQLAKVEFECLSAQRSGF